MSNKKVAIAYIPVLHKGYVAFVEALAQEGVEALHLISDEILASHEELDYINRKDRLRAVDHEVMKTLLAQTTSIPVESLTIAEVFALHESRASLVVPKEDISTHIIETYFGGHAVEYKNVFLRRNRENVGETDEPQASKILLTDFEKEIMGKVIVEAEKSADWWRQVGAALVHNGKLISIAHNEHMPEKELPNIIGDTRALFKKGINVNYVTAAHAEVGVIGEAARKGITTEGASLFVTDFPCPYCARLIAKSGIKKIYFMEGYAVLGGDEFFSDMGIEVIQVTLET